MPNPARRAVALAVLAAAIVAGAVALDLAPVAAQSDEQRYGKINARRTADDRIEFGWQPTNASGEAIGPRVLPRLRYFPPDAQVDRWLRSSPVEVGGAEIGRINARLRSDGRIEFAFTPTDGARIEPSARYFPVDARVGRWLRSAEITISPAPAAGFVAVSAGREYTCAIRTESGAIECWGNTALEGAAAPAGSFTAVSAGDWHTCAIRTNGAIECWGNNDNGQADAPAGSFSAVAAGMDHTCAIREDGAIQCWGSSNAYVWVGEAIVELYTGQADAPTGSFSAVAAGKYHSCAIRESGEITCWGGQPINLEGIDAEVWKLPTPPAGSFTAVTTSIHHYCAIRENGAIECWGDNDFEGQTDAPAGSFTAVSAGDWHTCAIREDGAIECWGDNRVGQTDAPAGSFTAVSAGDWHTCAIGNSGAIECWGGAGNPFGLNDPPTP